MKVTIHQPEHLPWLGFFNKMSMADVYVILDNVQYTKGNYQSRNKIMGTNGPQWLGVPVSTKGWKESTIHDMKFAEDGVKNWKRKYLNTIYLSYHRHPYFDKYYPYFDELMEKGYEYLCDFNVDIIMQFAEWLDIHPRFIRASELRTEGKKNDLVLSICKALNADVYISGAGGRNYMRIEDFEKVGVSVAFQHFDHPQYHQEKNNVFVPYMSTLDLLFNEDIEVAKHLIKSSGYCEDYKGKHS